jgi:hypothetical protein
MMRSAKLVAVVAALTACGRLGFDARAAPGPADAAGDAAPCTGSGDNDLYHATRSCQ